MTPVSFATSILMGLSYFLRLETDELRNIDKVQFQSAEQLRNTTYDFIIVGAGTAGCILAGRLSKYFNVLLLEAGGDPPLSTQVPAFYEYVSDSPDLNYFYKSIPQEKANNRQLYDGMGKMVGGSGSHNALVYNRGHPKDYDNWANITQDQTWSYESLLPIFKKAEAYDGVWPKNDQHGNDGPIPLETSTRPIYTIWKEAAEELGYTVGDPNGPQIEGFASSDVMRKDGRRVSTYTAYVKPYLWRKTLNVIKYAFVHKILFRAEKAIGVEYVRHGLKVMALASKEVIISAGTYASPLILMKSGIGPKKILAEGKIQQRIDLPVGKNLQNHNGPLLGHFRVKDHTKLSNINNNLTQIGFENYLNHVREHVLSESGLGPQAFFTSPEAKNRGEADWPDFQLFLVGTNFGGGGTTQKSPPNQFSIAVLVGRPEFNTKYLGSVTLNTTAYMNASIDNAELAVIDYKFFQSEQDYKVVKYAIKTAFKIFNTRAFKKIGTRYQKDKHCDKISSFDSDDYWDCYLRKTGRPWFHPAGTCRMGYGREDTNSVVDSQLRVHGFKNLRVVDASIMPQVTNANTNAPIVGIAEKASIDIITKYGSS